MIGNGGLAIGPGETRWACAHVVPNAVAADAAIFARMQLAATLAGDTIPTIIAST